MAIITVAEILERADILLQDNSIRWGQAEKINWINEAYRSIVLIRPDANMKTAGFLTFSGTKQVLTKSHLRIDGEVATEEPVRLHSVVRNIASGKQIRHIHQRVLDDQVIDWHAGSGVSATQFYCHDPVNPKVFYLYPAAALDHNVEVVYTAVPKFHDINTNTPASLTLSIDDVFAPVILDAMLYRCYSKDAEYTANAERAQQHYQAFTTALTNNVQATLGVIPVDDGNPT
jgi:hypothetical protein